MARFFRKSSKKAGLPPGTLIYTGDKKAEEIKIELIDYSKSSFQRKQILEVAECASFRNSSSVTWINLSGLHKVDIIGDLGALFGIHHLVLEDVLSTNQRPKIEFFDNYVFIVLKMIYYDPSIKGIHVEQISLIVGKNYVISFQETEGDVFDPIRERIKGGKGKIRAQGSDYLAYALMDTIVDNYFVILEKIGDKIEAIEDKMIKDPRPNLLNAVHKLKNDMILLRKSVWPLREVLSMMQRSESRLIKDSTLIYLRDVYDHTIQIMDTIESLRDVVSGMIDLYMSSMSNKMNEVMKVLTIIATIFIPLTFIVGVYGMNFESMPELHVRFAYPILWIIMFFIAFSMFMFFRKKKWL